MKIKSTFQLPKKQFTVYEDEWVNGSNANSAAGESALLNDNGNRCCVGFLAQACGLEDSAIADVGYLDDVLSCKITKKSLKSFEKISEKLNNGGGLGDRAHPDNIYFINDRDAIPNALRKTMLKEQFRKQLGLEVIFKPTRPNKKKRAEDKK